MSSDDYTSDPNPMPVGVPGTVDDLPASYGEDVPGSTDARTEAPGHAESTDDSAILGEGDESELWRHQKALIEEDEKEGLRLDGFPAEEIPDILEAMGDDAEDPLDDSPDGTSATGLGSGRDHGGFPERTD